MKRAVSNSFVRLALSLDDPKTFRDFFLIVKEQGVQSVPWDRLVREYKEGSFVPLSAVLLRKVSSAKAPYTHKDLSNTPATHRAQSLLLDCLVASGADVSLDSKVMRLALATPHPTFIARRHLLRPFSNEEMEVLRALNPLFSHKKVVELVQAWRKIPTLSELAEHWQSKVLSEGWLYPHSRLGDVKDARGNRDWSVEDADRFVCERLFPDLKSWNRDFGTPVSFDVAVSDSITENKVPLISLVSPSVWAKTVFSLPGNPFYVFCLRHKDGSMAPSLPANVSLDWVEQETDSIKKSFSSGSHLSANDAVRQHLRGMADSLVQHHIPGENPWRRFCAAQRLFFLANNSSTLINRSSKMVEGYLKSNASLPPESYGGVQVHSMALCAWINKAPAAAIVKELPGWGVLHAQIDNHDNKATVARCHGMLADAWWIRVQRRDIPKDQMPKVASIFWSHFLRADKDLVARYLSKLDPDSTGSNRVVDLFDLPVGDPGLSRTLDVGLSGLPMLKDHDGVKLKRIVLLVASRLYPPGAPTFSPKM